MMQQQQAILRFRGKCVMNTVCRTGARNPAGALSAIWCAHVVSKPSHVMQDVADACRTGAATDIIFGLALGYKSAIIPCFVIAICIYVSFSLANMYGIACAALGMLTTMSTGAPGLLCLRYTVLDGPAFSKFIIGFYGDGSTLH